MVDTRKFSTVACTGLLKLLLTIFNIIFIALGIMFLIIGIYGMTAFKDFFQFASSQQIYVPVICIGIFMFIVGGLALWCTPKGVSWLLYLYSIIVFILFLIIFTISILFMVRRDTFENTMHESIKSSINTYKGNGNLPIDFLQEDLHCCGVDNYTDWFTTTWANGEKNVPTSCCKSTYNKKCAHENLLPENATQIYTNGCFKLVHDTIENNYLLIGGIGFGSAVIILLGSILTCGLASNLKKNRYETVE